MRIKQVKMIGRAECFDMRSDFILIRINDCKDKMDKQHSASHQAAAGCRSIE
jgi:hypothetical protein